ncbi:hypothetical protein PR003_g9847 [Phytophthora rubi]|uniref:Uncharacterized protein n=1 Tax=Phytophthora rubi TaxID=129364 RepID=A0A6A3LE76_9STRA|nr:hypothetical protein PR002_g13728 [Phytophthora rubi]KAE9017577.1 hypothetical protein PR001_g14366 [Phytophthora rubi]KAE9341711.1 hypothetical protein PR003_g9847 [Phytophthora rubi]
MASIYCACFAAAASARYSSRKQRSAESPAFTGLLRGVSALSDPVYRYYRFGRVE